jgi:hypothetical protein
MPPPWFANYLPSKALNDLLRYFETKADAPSIYLFCLIDESKQLEKILLVLDFDADTGVSDRD